MFSTFHFSAPLYSIYISLCFPSVYHIFMSCLFSIIVFFFPLLKCRFYASYFNQIYLEVVYFLQWMALMYRNFVICYNKLWIHVPSTYFSWCQPSVFQNVSYFTSTQTIIVNVIIYLSSYKVSFQQSVYFKSFFPPKFQSLSKFLK